jgi:hypothetical protein
MYEGPHHEGSFPQYSVTSYLVAPQEPLLKHPKYTSLHYYEIPYFALKKMLSIVSIRRQQDGTLMAVANERRTYCTKCKKKNSFMDWVNLIDLTKI